MLRQHMKRQVWLFALILGLIPLADQAQAQSRVRDGGGGPSRQVTPQPQPQPKTERKIQPQPSQPNLNPSFPRQVVPGTLPRTNVPGTTVPGTTLPGTKVPGTLPGTKVPGTTIPGTTADPNRVFKPVLPNQNVFTPQGSPGSQFTPGLPGQSLNKLILPKDPFVVGKNGKDVVLKDNKGAGNPNFDFSKVNFTDRLKGGNFAPLAKTGLGQKYNFDRQFNLLAKGDMTRQLLLHDTVLKAGGWRKFAKAGPLATGFTSAHFGCFYPGGGAYPMWCWMPHWSPWVDWCWWDHCDPWCDPRPFWCRPIFWDPCGIWIYYDYPVWLPLPGYICGTWIDLPVVMLDDLDLQLLAVRFVDPGHPEKNLGPRYRVWFRNTSRSDINMPFNVLLMASNDRTATANLPQSGVRVTSIQAGQIMAVDIRLPMEANLLARDAQGHKIPFQYLHVLVDSHREIPEAFEENNGAILARVDILPVDPALFSADVTALAANGMQSVAGEGLGPEPGQLVMFVKGMELQTEIHGWYDLGVRAKLPNLPVMTATGAELVLIRGDGAVSNPLPITLLPTTLVGTVPTP